MQTLFPQFSSLPKTISLVLLFVIISNLCFLCIFLPTKEAKALMIVSDPTLTAEFVSKTALETAWEGLQSAYRAVDSVIQKITSVFSGVSAAKDIWDKAQSIAKDLISLAIQQLLYRILAMVTNDIIGWINGGGTPRFVQDWNAFLRDAANQAGGDFLDTLSGGFLCRPFAFQIKLALMPVNYFEASRCTLKDIGANLQSFFSDFSAGGGWGTWLQVIQPQNNFFGSYLMALEEKNKRENAAAKKSENEAMSGGGYLSAKKCMSCTVTNLLSGSTQSFSGSSECEAQKKTAGSSGEAEFKCTNEQMMSPPSLLQYEVQQAVDSGRKLISDQIAALTPNVSILGVNLAPFFSAIFSALINRVISQGLGAIGGLLAPNSSSENNYDNVYYNEYIQQGDNILPPPDEITTIPTGATAIEKTEPIQSSSSSLISSAELLKENLEEQLLVQQLKNLDVLKSIKNTQTQTLNLSKDLLANNCSLPYWISSELISSNTNNNITTEIIKLSASTIGEITVKKTTDTSAIGATVSVETQEIKPAIQEQLNAMENDIAKTNQQISAAANSITAAEKAVGSAKEFQTFFESKGGLTTSKEDTDEMARLEKTVNDDYAALLSFSQIAAQTTETDLSLITIAMGNRSSDIISEAQTIESNRETLNSQLSSISGKPAEVNSLLQACQ